MSLRIAIIGAGFIGLNLAEAFLLKGYVVNVLDRGEKPDNLTYSGLFWLQGDVGDRELVSELLSQSDIVFYLVSSTVPGDDVDVSKELFLNVSQLLQVLELCELYSVKKFIFFSSSSVYGAQAVIPISESCVPLPISAHGVQKLTMEYYIGLFSRRSDTDCKIVRLSNPFGPGQNIHGRQGFISIVIGHLKQASSVNIRGSGDDVRDYIYIDDVVDACQFLMTSESKQLVFNIGCGLGYSLNDVIDIFEQQLGYKLPVLHTKCRESDIPVSVLDVSKMNNEFGFNPRVSLASGIKKFLIYHNVLPDA